ncbi:MAG: tetratricopeptide repeat protein [Deltaproteobacteria bacterium]|nr:tetratricopeptide repeat protein [Deltaproteobacteria bacterium]
MRYLLGILLLLAISLVAAWSAASLLADGIAPLTKSTAKQKQRQMEQLDTALLLSPANAFYWNQRAELAQIDDSSLSFKQRDYLVEFSRSQASALAPSWEVPLLSMANQCASRQASNHLNDPTLCRSLYSAVLLRNPTYGFAHYSYAEFLCDQALAASPTKPFQVESICRKYGQSLHLMRRTLRNSWFRRVEARAYGRCFALVTDYSQARILKPETDRQWLLMGLGIGKKLVTKNWPATSVLVLKDLQANDADLDQYRALARGLEKAGQPFASYEVMRKYVASHPSDPEGWLRLLNTMLRHKKIFSGLQVLVVIKQAQKRAEFSLDQLLHLATAARRAGKINTAIDILENAILTNSDDPKAFVQLGECFMAAARPKEAIEAYKKAVVLSPKSSIYHVYLGLAYAKDKEYEAAVQAIQRALDLNPNDKKAKTALKKMGIY